MHLEAGGLLSSALLLLAGQELPWGVPREPG